MHHHSSVITFMPFPRTQICTTIASSFTTTPPLKHLQTLRRPPLASLRESRSNITFSSETIVSRTSMPAPVTNATAVAMAVTSQPSKSSATTRPHTTTTSTLDRTYSSGEASREHTTSKTSNLRKLATPPSHHALLHPCWKTLLERSHREPPCSASVP